MTTGKGTCTMTPTKIKYVAETLVSQLEKGGIKAIRFSPDRYLEEATQLEKKQHALFLLKNIPIFLEEGRLGKANRHLAAAQTCLSFARFATVEDSMLLNRP